MRWLQKPLNMDITQIIAVQTFGNIVNIPYV